MNLDVFYVTLSILWKGMLGIFVTVFLIMLVVFILSKISGRQK